MSFESKFHMVVAAVVVFMFAAAAYDMHRVKPCDSGVCSGERSAYTLTR